MPVLRKLSTTKAVEEAPAAPATKKVAPVPPTAKAVMKSPAAKAPVVPPKPTAKAPVVPPKPTAKAPVTPPKPAAKASVAPPKPTAKPTAKPVAASLKAKPGGKIQVGAAKKKAEPTYTINAGGRTTKDAFLHIFFDNMKKYGCEVESLRVAQQIVDIYEQTFAEVTDQSSIKIQGGMFRRRWQAPRLYSVPTTPAKTFVPGHWRVMFNKAVGELEMVQGKVTDDGTFVPGTFNETTGKFTPDSTKEPMDVNELLSSPVIEETENIEEAEELIEEETEEAEEEEEE
jgi:hypothetical protein